MNLPTFGRHPSPSLHPPDRRPAAAQFEMSAAEPALALKEFSRLGVCEVHQPNDRAHKYQDRSNPYAFATAGLASCAIIAVSRACADVVDWATPSAALSAAKRASAALTRAACTEPCGV
eukprot:CAMPEP_0183528308 /NCGR_PEP_ID=MMETSP0371-20130417/22628_1 /TAXON_ID=268820 /ORGANISM="Peridinium aciculiferum, Strain PAER-2" /LENGTH=118 /DNA_ID=CAMNT_0025727905 /DNA_START=299 /DNA_END=657 /DNA_ORIENTATION=-